MEALEPISRRAFVRVGGVGSVAAATLACALTAAPAPGGEAPSGTAKTGWEKEWDGLVGAAKKEGTLALVTTAGGNFRNAADEFEKAFPGVRVELTSMIASPFGPRVLQERKGSIYNYDVFTSTYWPVALTMIPEGALDHYYFPIVRHGVSKGGKEVMPPYKEKLSVKETWQVVTFINSFRPKMKQIDVAKELAEGAPADENTCIVTGGKLYASKCAQCHGEDLSGEGPASRVISDPVTDLKNGNWNDKLKKPGEDDYTYVFRIITTGSGGDYMGSFSNLSRFERWSLAKYVLSVRSPAMPKK